MSDEFKLFIRKLDKRLFGRARPRGTFLVVTCTVVVSTLMYVYGIPTLMRSYGDIDSSVGSSTHILGTSGKIYDISKKREYFGNRKYIKPSRGYPSSFSNQKHCDRWIVVTTIFPASQTIKTLASLEEWCMVVVADRKGPKVMNIPNLHYLDVLQQETCSYRICKLLPWNHFGRKNIGYLYAVDHGAKFIYDTDDDNLPLDKLKLVSPDSITHIQQIQVAGRLWNPYPEFGPSKDIWPRGFPLDHIKDTKTKKHMNLKTASVNLATSASVIQFLAQNDPDVDAIYRLEGPLPYSFDTKKRDPIAVPQYVMAPYNAQATLHTQQTFWGLLLPVTVHGRVSDIWRSYFTQRLLWDINGYLAFASPAVVQNRNAHNYMADFDSEQHLYHRSGVLVELLLQWLPVSNTLQQRVLDLYIMMYERGIIEKRDVDLALAWIQDLEDVGYTFPKLSVAKQFVYLIQAPTAGIVKHLVWNEHREIFWLTYEDQSGDICLPNRTRSVGRDALLDLAVSRASKLPVGGYEYYVFIDDDQDPRYAFKADMSKNPWKQLEKFLLNYEPAKLASLLKRIPQKYKLRTKPYSYIVTDEFIKQAFSALGQNAMTLK